jgi:hypothetical protein
LEFLQETSGTDGNDGATDGNRITAGTYGTKLKKQRRERRRKNLDNITYTILEVSLTNGEPIRLPLVAASYDDQCGCILRHTVSMNEKNIRENAELCASLILKLLKWYTFPHPHNNENLTKNLETPTVSASSV